MVSNDDIQYSYEQGVLLEAAAFDMDTYINGTDKRISLSAAITLVLMKYWINVQNKLSVIRHIDVQGSAALGDYSFTLSTDDIISGSTGVNIPTVDTSVYKKTITNSIFDYSVTNCTIKSFIVDYLLNPNDISDDYSVVVGGANAVNAYDDNVTNPTDLYTGENTVVWEVSFSERTLNEVHFYWYYKVHAYGSGTNANIHVQLNLNGVWTTILSKTVYYNNESSGIEAKHLVAERLLCTGIRINHVCSVINTTVNSRIYDISVFP